jgi:hypothetical protein
VGAVVGFLLMDLRKGSQLALATIVRQVKTFKPPQKDSLASIEFQKDGVMQAQENQTSEK